MGQTLKLSVEFEVDFDKVKEEFEGDELYSPLEVKENMINILRREYIDGCNWVDMVVLDWSIT